jgi:hypothetical protein
MASCQRCRDGIPLGRTFAVDSFVCKRVKILSTGPRVAAAAGTKLQVRKLLRRFMQAVKCI